MNTDTNSVLREFTRKLEEAAGPFIEQSAALAAAALSVAAVRELEKYRECPDLVKAGRLTLQVVVGAGALEIYLRDVETGAYRGPVFSFAAPIEKRIERAASKRPEAH